MKKRYIILLAVLTAFIISGCKGGKDKDTPAGTEEAVATAESPAEAETPAAAESPAAADSGESESPAAEGTGAPDYSVDYPFQERFVYGNKNLFYIEDDGTLRCEYKAKEDEIIEYGTGDPDRFFFITNGKDGQTLYFLDRDFNLGFTPISYPEEMYVSNISLLDGKLYYSGYDRSLGKDATYLYDPEGDAFDSDPRIDRLQRTFENYKGRNLTKLVSRADIARDIEETGCIYMIDNDAGDIYVFNDAGKEVGSFKADTNDGETKYFGPDYLIKEIHFYGDGEGGMDKERDQEYVLYDVRAGESYKFSIGKEDDSGVVDLKDGFFYYYEKTRKDDIDTGREYKRISIDNIKSGNISPETIVSLEQPPNIDCSYGSYTEGNNTFDAFTVKDDRVYYLIFDGSGDDGRKGDVVWRSVLLDDPSKEEQKTGAMERHETFADFGHVSASKDKRTIDDGFEYYVGEYQNFRFNDDIENADKLNAEMEKIDKEFKANGDETADRAYSEIVENGEEGNDISWFKEFIGQGYSYTQTFTGVSKVGKNHVTVTYDDYYYYGGAHGMGSSFNYLFSLKDGKRLTLKDLYEGSEKEFKDLALSFSMGDWKRNPDYYYESPDGTAEQEEKMRESFSEMISLDMNVCFEDDGLYLIYPPYAVGPYASGEIRVQIPYYVLGIDI